MVGAHVLRSVSRVEDVPFELIQKPRPGHELLSTLSAGLGLPGSETHPPHYDGGGRRGCKLHCRIEFSIRIPGFKQAERTYPLGKLRAARMKAEQW
jgi:hypothetical protein